MDQQTKRVSANTSVGLQSTTGNLYVSDSGNNTIRKITTDGQVSTVGGETGDSRRVDGTKKDARIYMSGSITVDKNGNIFFLDSSYVIRKLSIDGSITTVVGHALDGESSYLDGPGMNAGIRMGQEITADPKGNVFFTDSTANDFSLIRKFDLNSLVSTVAGKPGVIGDQDGPSENASFNHPQGIASDRFGNIYIADSGNNAIRKIDKSGSVTTVFASKVLFDSNDKRTPLSVYCPLVIATDAVGDLYFTDLDNVIKKITLH